MPRRRFHSRFLGLLARWAACVMLVAAGGCDEKASGPKLLLLLTVDTLRADHLGTYGGPAGLTPALDALARESLVFEAAYAPCSLTVPSLSTLLTGRYPEENGIYINEHPLGSDIPTIGSVLQRKGWQTGAIVSNYVLRAGGGLERGFDVYDARFPGIEAVRKLPERTAPDTTTDALALLDRLLGDDRPIFLWVHYQDPHGPYTPPAALRERQLARTLQAPDARRKLAVGQRGLAEIPDYQFLESRRDVAFYRAGYAAEVQYTDSEIGRFLRGVRERVPRDETVTVFSADHGEGLGEMDYWFAHGEYLSDALVRAPLFIQSPGRPPGRRRDVTSLVDLFPTLLALAGMSPVQARGRDLLAKGAAAVSPPIYLASLGASTLPRLGFISDGYKLVLTPRGGQVTPELYRLGAEEQDLATAEPQRAAALAAELSKLRSTMKMRKPGQARALRSDDVERLRSLGYMVE
jgi:arylsulfatase